MIGERLAIRLMIGQSVLFAAETALIHHLGSHSSLMLLATVRGAGGVFLALALARNIGFSVIRTNQLPLQLLRGTVSLLYLWVMIYSFGHLPLADATAISFTQTAYIAAFSVVILGERVSRSRWAAALLGIFGALLIAKPTFGGCNATYMIALFGTSLNGLSFVLSRYLQRKDTAATTMFYTNLVPLLGSAPFLATAVLPASETLLYLPGMLLIGPIGAYLGIVAVKHASAAMLGPYTQLRLVIALLAGVTVFRELPDVFSALGATLILASCMISSWASTGARMPLIEPARLRLPTVAG